MRKLLVLVPLLVACKGVAPTPIPCDGGFQAMGTDGWFCDSDYPVVTPKAVVYPSVAP